jgi:hypothetical protein
MWEAIKLASIAKVPSIVVLKAFPASVKKERFPGLMGTHALIYMGP